MSGPPYGFNNPPGLNPNGFNAHQQQKITHKIVQTDQEFTSSLDQVVSQLFFPDIIAAQQLSLRHHAIACQRTQNTIKNLKGSVSLSNSHHTAHFAQVNLAYSGHVHNDLQSHKTDINIQQHTVSPLSTFLNSYTTHDISRAQTLVQQDTEAQINLFNTIYTPHVQGVAGNSHGIIQYYDKPLLNHKQQHLNDTTTTTTDNNNNNNNNDTNNDAATPLLPQRHTPVSGPLPPLPSTSAPVHSSSRHHQMVPHGGMTGLREFIDTPNPTFNPVYNMFRDTSALPSWAVHPSLSTLELASQIHTDNANLFGGFISQQHTVHYAGVDSFDGPSNNNKRRRPSQHDHEQEQHYSDSPIQHQYHYSHHRSVSRSISSSMPRNGRSISSSSIDVIDITQSDDDNDTTQSTMTIHPLPPSRRRANNNNNNTNQSSSHYQQHITSITESTIVLLPSLPPRRSSIHHDTGIDRPTILLPSPPLPALEYVPYHDNFTLDAPLLLDYIPNKADDDSIIANTENIDDVDSSIAPQCDNDDNEPPQDAPVSPSHDPIQAVSLLVSHATKTDIQLDHDDDDDLTVVSHSIVRPNRTMKQRRPQPTTTIQPFDRSLPQINTNNTRFRRDPDIF